MSAIPAGIGSRDPWLRALPLVFLAGYFALGLLTLTNEHRWGDDWAQYVLHARNLVTGHPYPDTGYLFNPDAPYVGPASYPPGLPLVLAPFVAAFGTDIVAMKVAGLTCITLALPATYRLVAPVAGAGLAMMATLLLALHPVYWELRQLIQSEAPYLLFSVLTLWWAARNPLQNASRHAPVLAGIVLGVLLYMSVVSRAIGIAILPALLVYGWAQRKPAGWFVGMAFSFALLLWLQTLWLVAPPTYQSELRVPTVGHVSAQPAGYLRALAELFALPYGLATMAAAVLVVLVTVGAWFACARTKVPGAQPGGLRAIAARVPLALWYLAAYMSALFVASVTPDSRLLVPLLPILIPLAVLGVYGSARRVAYGRALLTAAALASVGYLLALHASGRYLPQEQMVTCTDCAEMFAYVRERTAADSVIVFNKPRAMALFADRRAWTPAFRYTTGQLAQRMARVGATLVVVGTQGSEFETRFPTGEAMRQRIQEAGTEILFRNDNFIVVRVPATRP